MSNEPKNLLNEGARYPISKNQVLDHARLLETSFVKFDEEIASANGEIERLSQGRARELERIQNGPASQRESGTQFINATFDEKLKEIRAKLSPSLWRSLGEIDGGVKLLSVAKEQHGHPLNIASTHALGSEERARANAEVANLLPAQLMAVHRHAEATNEKVLGAALIHRNDVLPKGQRPFNSSALAQKLFGADCEIVIATIKKAERGFAERLANLRAFDGVAPTPTQRIAHALRHGVESRLPHSGPRVQAKPQSPVQKIAANL